MARLLEYLVWITVISISSAKCKHFDPQTSSYNSEEHSKPRSSDHQRMLERSAVGSGERVNERTSLIHEPRRIQDQGRRRGQTKVDTPRIENGTLKILNYPSAASRRGAITESTYSDRVIFPGPTSKSIQQYVPDIPEECKKIGICDNVPNYPQEYVDNVIRQLGDAVSKFQIDKIDISDTPDIAQRVGPQDEAFELCDFREKVIYPLAAPDESGKWYVIVNKKEKPIQGYKVEICDKDKSPCSRIVKDHYKATCLQKHVYRSMTALDANGKPITKSFKVPSCCSCVAHVPLTDLIY